MLLPILTFATDGSVENRTHHVLVSVAPYKFFVDQIAGNTVTVDLFVPVGASFHSYEPTPKQILVAGSADVWFRIGEAFEFKALEALRSHRPDMLIVDLRQGVNLIVVDPAHAHCCCHANSADLHIWLSPKEAKIQARTIADALIVLYPEHRNLYQERLKAFLKSLDTLDHEISTLLKPLKHRVIMMSHPAYAYFARDYHLTQLPIEYEGKDPSPKQLGTILGKARQDNIKVIFVQKPYGIKAANLIAKEIGASIVELNPYSEDYINEMRFIAQKFAASEAN